MERTTYRNLLFATVGLLSMTASRSQTYTQPTVGVQNTYTGACMVTTCSGTFYDNGGAAGNYAANVNSIFRTFCPNAPGMCMRATFTSFSMNDQDIFCFGGVGGVLLRLSADTERARAEQPGRVQRLHRFAGNSNRQQPERLPHLQVHFGRIHPTPGLVRDAELRAVRRWARSEHEQ